MSDGHAQRRKRLEHSRRMFEARQRRYGALHADQVAKDPRVLDIEWRAHQLAEDAVREMESIGARFADIEDGREIISEEAGRRAAIEWIALSLVGNTHYEIMDAADDPSSS